MEIFKAFGLDAKMLIAQLVNFAILIFILYKFAYKPLFKVLEERRKKIEDGIENAARSEEKLKELSDKEKEMIKEAKKDAAAVLDEARRDAEASRQRSMEKTREEIGQIINKEREGMRLEKAEALREIKKDAADLVAGALEKVLAEKIDSAKDEEFIRRELAKIK